MPNDTGRQVAIEAKHLRPRLDHVSLRTDVAERLSTAFDRRLTVVCAPAGYGKSTTTAAALEDCGRTASWYKLDVLDHDPQAFLAAMTRAVQRVHPDFGEALLRELESGPVTDLPAEVLAARFCSECDRLLRADLHLVLDDYHEAMDSASLNGVLGYLLENCTASLHFIVLTRYEPAFRLEKLHLAGDVARVPRDLFLFDTAQVAEILAQRSGHRHPPEHIQRLHELTEGWPASVVLAGMALAWLDVTSLEATLADPRLRTDVFSYLAEQVFQRQSGDIQRFLLDTCCLEHVTAELAETLTGTSTASRHLHYLARNHIFTFDTERVGAYRYHNLLRDFLRQRFVQDEGEAAFRVLQRETAVALEACGDRPGAVELLLGANELDLALGVIARGGEALLERRPSEQLRMWAARLAASIESSNPWALVVSGVSSVRESQFAQGLEDLRLAAERLIEASDGSDLYQVLSITEWAEFWAGDSCASMRTSHQALAVASSDSQRLHTLLSLASAGLDMRLWDVVEEAFGRVTDLLPGARDEERTRARALKAHATYYRGNVRGARDLMNGLDESEGTIAQKAASLNTRGMIDLALADYASADRCFRDACLIAEDFGRSLTAHIEDNAAFLDASLGRYATALEQLERIEHTSTALDPSLLCWILMHKGTALRRSGNPRESLIPTQQAIEIVGADRDPYLALNCRANHAFAEGLLGGRHRATLQSIQSDACVAGLDFVRLKALMYAGLLAEREGDTAEAIEVLEVCIPEQLSLGHINLIAQELAPLPHLAAELLRQYPLNGLGSELVAALSHHWRFAAFAPVLQGLGPPEISTWLVPVRAISTCHIRREEAAEAVRKQNGNALGLSDLTARESQVLELMAHNQSNEEIASQLFIALSTVKTHVNHILRKLEQSTRVGAVLEYQRLVGPSPPSSRSEINPRYDSNNAPRN